ncbi:MAG: hypothetical protein Q8K98_04580 [Bacteroidota bacterium]|nr:hypothetical protein [Bacteroidota bacterium]
MKKNLTIPVLITEAKSFCKDESKFDNKDLFGVTDGKAVGTFISALLLTALIYLLTISVQI